MAMNLADADQQPTGCPGIEQKILQGAPDRLGKAFSQKTGIFNASTNAGDATSCGKNVFLSSMRSSFRIQYDFML